MARKKGLFEWLTGSAEDDYSFDDLEQGGSAYPTRKGAKHVPITIEDEPGAAVEEEEAGELAVDVYQTPTHIIIKAMIAGVKPEDLDVSITRDMVTVRGVNVFPGGVENIIRNFTEVDEFRITVNKVRQMDEMEIEVELCAGTDPELIHAIASKLDTLLAFRPRVRQVAHNALPRFEMKAKRFHVKLDGDEPRVG